MTDILYPSKSRRFMSEMAGVRMYHRNSGRAAAAARGGVLRVAVCKSWSCNPDRVASSLAIIERQERQSGRKI